MEKLDFNDAKARIDELVETLRYHSKRYYEEDAPEISDFEYDKLFYELVALEDEFPELAYLDSPTKRVGCTRPSAVTASEDLIS